MNLKGILPDRAVQAITDLTNSVSGLKTRFNALNQRPLLDKPTADALYGPAATRAALQVNGSHPLNTMGLVTTLVGPGAGTYTVGAKLTSGGHNGTITIDANGRITAIQTAT